MTPLPRSSAAGTGAGARFPLAALGRVQRLLSMKPPEIVYRGRQEAWKWAERSGVCRRRRSPRRLRGAALERAGALLDEFGRTASDRFFDGATSAHTPTVLDQHFPAAGQDAIATAQAACGGRFDLLGYPGLFFGDSVDWQLDPVSGRRPPMTHWSRLQSLDPAAVGDCKVIWELNRHQWLVRLGQAYRLTGDERYAERFVAYVQEWLAANPRAMGINWASSVEVALRLISWCWALCLFRGAGALRPQFFLTVVEAIEAHATHVARYLSRYFSPNTHLTGEALGLFYAGVVFPRLRPAGRWRAVGARILVEECERQVLPDGVYFEQSSCYQRYTAEIYLHFLILAARNGVEVPAAVGRRVQRMLDFLLAMRRPDGSMPQVGDTDGGSLLPLTGRAPDDVRGVFSVAAAVFHRSDYAWAAGGPAPESLWLLGPGGQGSPAARRSTPPSAPSSRLFARGGYAIMRSGWHREGHHLIFDVGPLGCPVSGAHGHADLLSIQCSVFGEAYIVDPGTYSYAADPVWRDFFRSTGAHSTVVVDGAEQAVPDGPFAWHERPRARLRHWLSTGAFDLAAADHEAYGRLADPVVHRRRVAFVKPRYWVIADELEGTAEHRLEVCFQFAPMSVTLDPAPWVRAQGPGGHGLLVRSFASVPLEARVITGELAPIRGWVSTNYGQRRPAPMLTYSAVARLPLRILTLLWPVEDPDAPPPAVSGVGGDPGPVGLSFGDGQERVLFEGQTLGLERR